MKNTTLGAKGKRLSEDGKSFDITLSLPKNLDANDAPETHHLSFEELTKALKELTELIEEFKRLSGGLRSETSTGGNP